jgi:hypothetical protein
MLWLQQHRVFNAVVVLAYIGFVLFAHEAFVALSVRAMNALSLPVYNRVVALVVALAPLVLGLLVFRMLKQPIKPERKGVYYLLAVLAGLVIHFFVFTEMNIEFIHALEFGVLAVLIYPLVGRFGAAIVCTLPVMLADEWYQYQVLFDYVEYFDFNDILVDLLGAGLFLSMLRVAGVGSNAQPTLLQKRWEVYMLLFMAALTVVLLSTNALVCYPIDATDATWLVLNAIRTEYGFWRVHPLIGSSYHVLEPVAGMLTVWVVCVAYLFLDSSQKREGN